MTGSLAAVLVDPVVVTWKALGAPAPVATSGPVARCGRCGQEQSLNLLREILSSNFTGWEQVDPASSGLCASCSWAYQYPQLRTRPIIISRSSAQWADTPALIELLAKPLSFEYAVSLPMRGQKHLLPAARWGGVSTDNGVISWNEPAAELLRTMLLARVSGATKSDFESDAPSIEVVGQSGADAFTWWGTFRRWRGTSHFQIAQHLATSKA